MEDTTIKDNLKTVEALYHQGDYQGAIRLLENNQIHMSAGLWHYNMGTLYAKLEKLPLSRYHFIRADFDGYSSKDFIKNKKIVETKLDIPRYEKSLSIVDYLLKGSLEATQGFFTMLSLSMIVVGLYLAWRRTNLKAFVFSVIFSFFILIFNFWVQNWKKFIVVENQTLYEGPSSIFSSNNELPAGVMVIVLEKDDWLKIVYPSRFSGWIKNAGIRELR